MRAFFKRVIFIILIFSLLTDFSLLFIINQGSQKPIFGDILDMKIKKLREVNFKWPQKAERIFPKKTNRNFYDQIYKNLKNYIDGSFIKRNYEFGYFCIALESHNRRLRKFNIFVFWLWLCIVRPWKKRLDSSFWWQEWILFRNKIFFDQIIDILDRIKDKYEQDFSMNKKLIKNFFPYYYDRENIRRNVKRYFEFGFLNAVFLIGLKDYFSGSKTRFYQNKFLRILKQKEFITKRDLQRSLKIYGIDFKILITWAEKEGLAKIDQYPANKVWITYIKPS